MYYEQDWVMRQVQMMTSFITKVAFHKDSLLYEIPDETNLSSSDSLNNTIQKLIDEEKIREAEDLLFENLDHDNPAHRTLALDFYQTINRLSDGELEKQNFSRIEVQEGLQQILKKFRMNSLEPSEK